MPEALCAWSGCKRGHCGRRGRACQLCPDCQSVGYCSLECRLKDRACHAHLCWLLRKKDCNSCHREQSCCRSCCNPCCCCVKLLRKKKLNGQYYYKKY
jgi:hypothetical protein